MPCYHPIKAYRVPEVKTPNGKAKIVFYQSSIFKPYRKDSDRAILLPCGKCVGCRKVRARDWAVRCVHEARMHPERGNCFITLTFADDYLNPSGSLIKSNFVNFMKRLRKRFVPKVPDGLNDEQRDQWLFENGIRFFHCGEYGSKLERPHHHACLFNFDFPDKVLWKEKSGFKLYRSPILEELWSDPKTRECYGFCTIGDVTPESASYVASYVNKKQYGDKADEYYDGREPEYITMSRRPGIGRKWLDKFADEIYPEDVLLFEGMKLKPPKYYDKVFMLTDQEKYERIVSNRMKYSKENPDNADDRLKVREKVAKAKQKLKQRSLEQI